MGRMLGLLMFVAAAAVWLFVSAGPALGQGSGGTVTATVQVQAAACMTIAPSSFAYAPAGLSTTSGFVTTLQTGTKPVATNCSTATENFLARGGQATGTGATWDLASAFDCSVPHTNQYKHEVRPQNLSFTALSTMDIVWESGVPAGASRTLETRLTMPCTGSNGVGVTISIPIVLTAVVQ